MMGKARPCVGLPLPIEPHLLSGFPSQCPVRGKERRLLCSPLPPPLPAAQPSSPKMASSGEGQEQPLSPHGGCSSQPSFMSWVAAGEDRCSVSSLPPVWHSYCGVVRQPGGSLEEVLLGVEAAETSAYAELRAEVCRSDYFAHSLTNVCKQEKKLGKRLWNSSITLVHMPETQEA